MAIPPKETVLKFGRHQVVISYMPDRKVWVWKLTLVKHYHFAGAGGNPTECRLAAVKIIQEMDKTYEP